MTLIIKPRPVQVVLLLVNNFTKVWIKARAAEVDGMIFPKIMKHGATLIPNARLLMICVSKTVSTIKGNLPSSQALIILGF